MTRINTVCALALVLAAAGCGKDDKGKAGGETPTKPEPEKPKTVDVSTLPKAPPVPPAPLGLPPTPDPPRNPTTAERVMLGKMLFFDTRISDGGEFSCESCHYQDKGWADGKQFSPKHNGDLNKRHSPTLFNVGYANEFYWDGRKPSLEAQILAAWTGQVGATPDKVAATINGIPEYAAHFERAFGAPANQDTIVFALAAYVRTLRAGNSPWDRYEKGDQSAVGPEVVAGFKVFTEKANCALCHAPPLYMDTLFHNTGIGFKDVEEPDVGRFAVSKKPEETGAFKTPTLRGVTLHPPYFHDGSAATLEEAVDFMIGGGYREGNEHIDPKLKPAKLSDEERTNLIAFIVALTPDQGAFEKPTLPQ